MKLLEVKICTEFAALLVTKGDAKCGDSCNFCRVVNFLLSTASSGTQMHFLFPFFYITADMKGFAKT